MSKKIIYTDEFGNKIDINSIEGIHVILNDIFMTSVRWQHSMENALFRFKRSCMIIWIRLLEKAST